MKDVRQFLGLPLHSLTRKNDGQESTGTVLKKLTEAPVLTHPSVNTEFTIETDTGYTSLRAILSQEQGDGCLHLD